MKKHMELKDKEKNLLKRQVDGLQEDNDRIARMYQMVQNVATTKLVSDDDLKPNAAYLETMKKDREVQNELKGFKRAEVDFGDSFGQKLTTQAMGDKKTHDPHTRVTPTKNLSTTFDQRATVKRE